MRPQGLPAKPAPSREAGCADRPPEASNIGDVRGFAAAAAARSFVFFVRALLGLRHLSELRCVQLAEGEGAAARPFERQLLLQWADLRAGRPPAAAAWAFPGTAEGGGGRDAAA